MVALTSYELKVLPVSVCAVRKDRCAFLDGL